MRSALLLVLVVSTLNLAAEAPQRFFKGNTHAHSLWSDGNDFPEMIIDYYHRSGYDFAVLSDHNVLADGYRWQSLEEIYGRQKVDGPDAIEKCIKRFGPDWITWETLGGERGISLKRLDEYRHLFEEPGEFLIIEAEEISDKSAQGPVHINALNLERLVGPLNDDELSTVQVMRQLLRTVKLQEEEIGRPIMTHLNHPNFYWGVTAEDLAAVVEERFFEVYNGHPKINHHGDPHRPGDEMIWDIANTIRIAEMGEAPLMGVATDDSHTYHGGDVSPGRGWVMVDSEELTADSLIYAMRAGDFYASTGITLTRVSYDAASRVIELEIEADGGAEFTSELIGTRMGYEDAIVQGIGETLATSTGRSVRFEIPEDAYYARVVVTSFTAHPNPSFEDQHEQAWTQPVGWR